MQFIKVVGILSLVAVCASAFINGTSLNNFTNGTSKDVLISQRSSIRRGYILNEDLGSYYKYQTTPNTWPNARGICESEGGHLVIINSEKEASFLLSLMGQHPASSLDRRVTTTDYIFIGFHDLFKDWEFVTVLDQTIEAAGYFDWVPGGANNAGGNEKCGSLWRNGGLNDITCNFLLTFVCEIPVNACDYD
ncbi:hemolymph lipopolysaccharide-binding protein-like [Chrysoperla carnea]|uniref:hemolymph lipopolysaccharide-binding protein-like n=1 Tax=Chrysoperla carnea TaxID=189513 RepID=UPI001D0753E5|nr:hemolymph lipopolysaccharide-binding protein-like [Chrysoperla carnea]